MNTQVNTLLQAKAQMELQNILADVRRGIWQPAEPEPAPEVNRDPAFHEFASQWFEANQGEWRPKTVRDYEWQLISHLLPFFKNHRLSQITVAEVDRYRQTKVAQNKAIQAAAAKGKPLTAEYVDKRGRTHHRPRRASYLSHRSTRPSRAWGRSSKSPSSTA